MSLQTIDEQLDALMHRIDAGDCDVRRDLFELACAVRAVVAELQRVDSAAWQASNTASCLTNGIKPD